MSNINRNKDRKCQFKLEKKLQGKESRPKIHQSVEAHRCYRDFYDLAQFIEANDGIEPQIRLLAFHFTSFPNYYSPVQSFDATYHYLLRASLNKIHSFL
jgi:hypothetical protein